MPRGALHEPVADDVEERGRVPGQQLAPAKRRRSRPRRGTGRAGSGRCRTRHTSSNSRPANVMLRRMTKIGVAGPSLTPMNRLAFCVLGAVDRPARTSSGPSERGLPRSPSSATAFSSGTIASIVCLPAATSSIHSRYSPSTSRMGPSPRSTPSTSQRHAVARRLDRGEVVRHEHERRALVQHVAHPVEAPLLERRVADREDLVDEEDVGIEERGDREAEAHLHAARIELHLPVDGVARARRTRRSRRTSRHLARLRPSSEP